MIKAGRSDLSKALDLMSTYADILFTYDRRGRMLSSNEFREEERHPAPHLYLGYATGGYIVRFGASVADGLARQLEEIVDREPPVGDLYASPPVLAALRAALERHAAITEAGGGPVYRFPEPVAGPGGAVELTDANVELARDTYPWLLDQLADWGPCFAVVRDGAVVSVCFSARVGTKAMAAGVDTLPAFRGRGYAAVVTAAWGAAIRESGRIPIYSTAWDNLPSQAVARRLGLIMFGAEATLA